MLRRVYESFKDNFSSYASCKMFLLNSHQTFFSSSSLVQKFNHKIQSNKIKLQQDASNHKISLVKVKIPSISINLCVSFRDAFIASSTWFTQIVSSNIYLPNTINNFIRLDYQSQYNVEAYQADWSESYNKLPCKHKMWGTKTVAL